MEHDWYRELVNRIANMIVYGLTKEEIRAQLFSEGLREDEVFFAFCGAQMKLDWEGPC